MFQLIFQTLDGIFTDVAGELVDLYGLGQIVNEVHGRIDEAGIVVIDGQFADQLLDALFVVELDDLVGLAFDDNDDAGQRIAFVEADLASGLDPPPFYKKLLFLWKLIVCSFLHILCKSGNLLQKLPFYVSR